MQSDPDHMRREVAWTSGYAAAKENKPREACDQQPGTIFYDDWHDGYAEAERNRS